MRKPLNQKVALVTGGSRGIGAAIVRRLVQEGADVAFTYSKSAKTAGALAKEVSGSGVKVKAYPADAAVPKSMPRLVEKVLKDFGRLDIVVNNAGVFLGGENRGHQSRCLRAGHADQRGRGLRPDQRRGQEDEGRRPHH
jgi:NAD(P)-dependent dehydrogenase (short-subunit alcohol dehydrogenase family)